MFNNFFKNKEIEIAKEAVKNHPDNILKLNILGKLYFEGNFYNEAIKIFEKILKIDENYVLVFEPLSKCYIAKKQYLKAFRTIKYWLHIVPEDSQAKNMLFSLENSDCETEVKIEILQEILKFEDKIETKEKLGNCYITNGQFSKSSEIFENLLKIDEKPAYLITLCEIYSKLGKIPKATAMLEKLMLTQNFNMEHAQILAELYVKEQRFEEAKGVYELLIQSSPENAQKFNKEIAKILLLEKNPDKAIEITRNVIEQDKFSAEAKFLQAEALIEKKDYANAIDFLKEFYSDPIDKKTEQKIEKLIIETSILYSQKLRAEKKYTEAIDALMPALRYDENNKNIYTELARISTEIRDFSAAKEYMKIAESL